MKVGVSLEASIPSLCFFEKITKKVLKHESCWICSWEKGNIRLELQEINFKSLWAKKKRQKILDLFARLGQKVCNKLFCHHIQPFFSFFNVVALKHHHLNSGWLFSPKVLIIFFEAWRCWKQKKSHEMSWHSVIAITMSYIILAMMGKGFFCLWKRNSLDKWSKDKNLQTPTRDLQTSHGKKPVVLKWNWNFVLLPKLT